MSFRKASSSFQACGRVIGFQLLSSKFVVSASFVSPTKSFQSELKLYFARGPFDAVWEKVKQEQASKSSIKIEVLRVVNGRDPKREKSEVRYSILFSSFCRSPLLQELIGDNADQDDGAHHRK